MPRCTRTDSSNVERSVEGIALEMANSNNCNYFMNLRTGRRIKGNVFGRKNVLFLNKSKVRLKAINDEIDTNMRKVVQTEGRSTVLVLRITDRNGDQPSKTARELSDDIFGTDGDVLNLVRLTMQNFYFKSIQ